jgi:hypothetical protein
MMLAAHPEVTWRLKAVSAFLCLGRFLVLLSNIYEICSNDVSGPGKNLTSKALPRTLQ